MKDSNYAIHFNIIAGVIYIVDTCTLHFMNIIPSHFSHKDYILYINHSNAPPSYGKTKICHLYIYCSIVSFKITIFKNK